MPNNKMTQLEYLDDICQQLGELTDIKKLLKETNEKLDLVLRELRDIDQNTRS